MPTLSPASDGGAPKTWAVTVPADVLDTLKAELIGERRTELADSASWPDWLDVKTAARYLGCDVGAVRKVYERRRVAHYPGGPGCKVYLRRSELDAYASSGPSLGSGSRTSGGGGASRAYAASTTSGTPSLRS